jgi:hypothetical protein
VWSFGIILGELATRQLPFAAVSYLQAMSMIAGGSVMEEVMPEDTPAWLDGARRRCLVRECDERADMVEMSGLLFESTALHPPPAAAASSMTRRAAAAAGNDGGVGAGAFYPKKILPSGNEINDLVFGLVSPRFVGE